MNKKVMKKICISLGLACLILSVSAQNNTLTLGQAMDELTYKWDVEAQLLSTYDGLIKFCDDKDYRFQVIELLNEIHHFDSVLYQRLVKVQRFNDDKEIEKTIKDIRKFEKNYSMKDLIHFLHKECNIKNEIEKNAAESRNDIGENSYDGQIYITEVELNKYIKHITKRVDVIRKHVHHLHIE